MRTYDIINAGPKNRFIANGKCVSNSGRNIQLQNLPQNHITTLDEARELVKMGCFDMIESIYGNVPDILSQLVRTMLIPKEGCEFIVADFSAIEARVLAWLSGEQWRLDAFKRGDDIYCASASAMFHVPVVKHGINGELRQRGKVAELACIAEGQLVLTDKGLVPIEKVTTDMKVWDGEEWVTHDGVIYRGEREVITYEGLTATPDHLVFHMNQYLPFGEIARKQAEIKGIQKVYDIRNAGRHHRFTVSGKLVHNCGYGGGNGALISMGALGMGLKEEELSGIISSWREANPNIVKFWYAVEKAAIETVKDHSDRTVGKIGFQFSANVLWIVLPSGRRLAYIKPQLQPNRFGRMAITFEGQGTNNKWVRQETYSGKLVENCIAKGTLVLTYRGLIPIESIKTDDLIWDGIEWVHHEGLLCKGFQSTVEVVSNGESGIHMTPQHKILTQKGWVMCSEANGFNWADISLPDSDTKSRGYKIWKNTMAMPMCMRKRSSSRCRRFKKEKISNKILRMHEAKANQQCSDAARYDQTSCMGCLAFDETTMSRPQSSRLSQLWRQGHNSLRTLAGKFREFLARHGSHMAKRTGFRPNRQQRGIQSRKLQMDNKKSQFQKQTQQSYCNNIAWNYDSWRTCRKNRYWRNNPVVSHRKRLDGRITVNSTGLKEYVYDIRNCGSRHRFAVWDSGSDKIRIVSNCTQATARDILVEAMKRIEDAGLDIVGHVHDEVILEVPKGKYTVEDVCSIMNQNPEWAEGLPLASDGYRGDYYFKS